MIKILFPARLFYSTTLTHLTEILGEIFNELNNKNATFNTNLTRL
jgi:hypothetical protein